MPLKYGDVVSLVQKSSDGSIIRTNAFVLASSVQAKDATRSTGLRGPAGLLPEGEYLDLVFLAPLPAGQSVKTRGAELFRFTNITPAWKSGAWIGWEVPAAPVSPDAKKLRDFLFANFKDETGNETPEACAIRLLGKTKTKK